MKRRDLILIIDFGSQYTQLIARRVRELDVYSEIHPHTISFEEIKNLHPKGIILSGGPASGGNELRIDGRKTTTSQHVIHLSLGG